MTIHVEVYGWLTDLVGGSRQRVEVEGSLCTVRDAVDALAASWPGLRASLPSVAVALGDRIVGDDQPLSDGATIALLPPVSGG